MKRFMLFLSAFCLLVIGPIAFAQSGGGYELTWTTVAASGGALTGGAYSLVSSIGQPEPGATQSGGAYSLNGGVIDTGESGETTPPEQKIFVPLIQR